MDGINSFRRLPEQGTGFSVVMAEKVLNFVRALELPPEWDGLWMGHPTRRRTSYKPRERVAAVLAGLACGVRGIGPGNLLLRTNSALVNREGRFPDQGTIHRWLQQATAAQAAAFRTHLHRTVRTHGRFVRELWSERLLVVDIDGQGLVARGQRFEEARVGYMDEGLDRGFQRYVAYVGLTGEVLDELLLPGNTTLMSALAEVLAGLREVFPHRRDRRQVLLRIDSHGGTVPNLRRIRQEGYHYLCALYSHSAVERLARHVERRRPERFDWTDSEGRIRRIRSWVMRNWTVTGTDGGKMAIPYATVFHDPTPGAKRPWTVLVSSVPELSGPAAWREYHPRSGTIEEYNDQSERAFHLEVMRTGNLDGLNVVEALVGLCWNLARWALADLDLPPVLTPAADPSRWVAATTLDLSHVLERASYSGLQLVRRTPQALLEVGLARDTPEARAWLRWLKEPFQHRLRLSA